MLLHVVQLGWFPIMVQAVHASIDVQTGSHCTVAAGASVYWGMHGVESGPGFRPSAITMPAMPAATARPGTHIARSSIELVES